MSVPADRWIDGIVITGRCWEHVNKPDANGYRKVWIRRHLRLAHRVMYEWLVGPIPDGSQIDHLCRNRGCLNPGHMEHEFTVANTRVNKHGRRCRTCHRERMRRYNSEKCP